MRLPVVGSRLGRTILVLNLLGLLVIVAGALTFNEFRRGLISARVDSLTTQGAFITNVIVRAAARGDPAPALDAGLAADTLQLVFIPHNQRVRLFDVHGEPIADSYVLSDHVDVRTLPPARKPGQPAPWRLWSHAPRPADEAAAQRTLQAEVAKALTGTPVAEVRRTASGVRVVSVSLPIQNVQAVLGVLTLEAADVDSIVAAQRAALVPFILIAVLVTLISSLFLNTMVARPIMRLARAADGVRLSRERALRLPDVARRTDEVGDLARALDAMTNALTTRMDAIERFAADVSHEIKNPLTSVRSAVETLEMNPPEPGRTRLLGILKADVKRLDRLITDISNASRLDAELSRDAPRAVDLGRLLADIVALYPATGGAAVMFEGPAEPALVSGREAPLGQVFRNLIDNARSFSPPGGAVRVRVGRERDGSALVQVDDDGPGIPPENLESVFQRFYTNRPRNAPGGPAAPGGTAFGGHSGLGLSIARQIVEAHGGRITAENRPAPDPHKGGVAGARFTVVLPAAAETGDRTTARSGRNA